MLPRTITTVFLDDGGVLNDNERRGEEWPRLVGEFFAPRLGGEPAAWGEANEAVFGRQWQRFLAWRDERIAAEEYGDFFGSSEERARWVREMCEHTGVAPPEGAALVALAREADAYIIPRVRSAFPGAAGAVRELHRRGYALAMASGTTAAQLDVHLRVLGVRECFAGRLYGPDLVRVLKGDPRFHAQVLADAGVEPGEALVVDDTAEEIERAAGAGAFTVHVCRDGTAQSKAAHGVIADLSELPSLLGGR